MSTKRSNSIKIIILRVVLRKVLIIKAQKSLRPLKSIKHIRTKMMMHLLKVRASTLSYRDHSIRAKLFQRVQDWQKTSSMMKASLMRCQFSKLEHLCRQVSTEHNKSNSYIQQKVREFYKQVNRQ